MVLVLMFVARDVEAARTVALVEAVPAEIAAAKEVEAVVTSDCTASDPAERPAPVKVRVPYVQTSDAVRVEPTVLPPKTSCLPAVPAVMKVEVATFQTSAANVPKVVRERAVVDQTAVGMVAKRDEEAVKTVELVLLLIVVIAEVN